MIDGTSFFAAVKLPDLSESEENEENEQSVSQKLAYCILAENAAGSLVLGTYSVIDFGKIFLT